jgi:UDP-N-acetylmuramyl pentapeptide phosphotransferase/UDP-N-acetylglucosamine-1-phosphate transferase
MMRGPLPIKLQNDRLSKKAKFEVKRTARDPKALMNTPPYAWIVVGAFLTSFALTTWLVWSAHHHSHLSADHDLDGPQKFHATAVPRVGGVGVCAGTLVGCLLAWWMLQKRDPLPLMLMACSAPAFGAGLIEDLTKKVSARHRLYATMIAAALGGYFLSAWIPVERLGGLTWMFPWPALVWLATLMAVGGVANAINIIDGFNGLASMCSALMFTTISLVAFQVGDNTVGLLALICAAAVLGFFVLNYPAGLIFLGDGGSYFIGFMVAELALLLTTRNASVSPYFALMLCAYPVLETVFSIYRRKVVRGVPAMSPDGIHLHTLIYRRMIRHVAPDLPPREITQRNSMTAPYLWALCTLSLLPALLFWDRSAALLMCMAGFVFLYVYLYARIVRFKTPTWLTVFSPSRSKRK